MLQQDKSLVADLFEKMPKAAPEERAQYDFLKEPEARPQAQRSEQLLYPLAIVLVKAEYDRWQEHKWACKAQDDRAALLALLGE